MTSEVDDSVPAAFYSEGQYAEPASPTKGNGISLQNTNGTGSSCPRGFTGSMSHYSTASEYSLTKSSCIAVASVLRGNSQNHQSVTQTLKGLDKLLVRRKGNESPKWAPSGSPVNSPIKRSVTSRMVQISNVEQVEDSASTFSAKSNFDIYNNCIFLWNGCISSAHVCTAIWVLQWSQWLR